jgi:LCP family protein required for cell wall assembly
VITALSVTVLAMAGVGHSLLTGIDDSIARIDPFRDMKNRPHPGNGTNVLLVGTDGRDKISATAKRKYRLGGQPCHCTDTVMIVHISEDRDRASVVSLPRDSFAVTPEYTDPSTGRKRPAHPVRLNAAYAEGGPQLTVRTVEKMTAVKIDHYVEVDFTSFIRTVDVLGGVRICTVDPLKDSHTGLDLPPGQHRLDGGRSLQYVRSRHVDAASDFGRMHRQQRFLAALIEQATSSGVLLNPVKLRNVAGTVLASVRADRGFGAGQMIDLGRAMRRFSPSSSEFTTVPIAERRYRARGVVGETLKWNEKKARQIFAALRADRPLAPHVVKRPKAVRVPVAPEQIRVQVENGTMSPGLGKRVDAGLAATGFVTTKAPVDGANRAVRRTVVLHDPRWDRSARSLAAALPGSEVRARPGLGPTLRVVAGADFHGVRRVRAEDPYQGEDGVITGDQVVCE